MLGKNRLERYKNTARALATDDRGAVSAREGIKLVIAIFVSVLVAAFLYPIALDEMFTANTSNWSSGAVALWDILPLVAVLALFMYFIGSALMSSGRI